MGSHPGRVQKLDQSEGKKGAKSGLWLKRTEFQVKEWLSRPGGKKHGRLNKRVKKKGAPRKEITDSRRELCSQR